MTSHATLTWTPENAQPRRCTFTARCDIGRAPSNRIILANPRVSRHHARLQLSKDGLMLQNHSRSAAVMVGSRRLVLGEQTSLNQGDSFQIGGQVLSVTALHVALTELVCSNAACGRTIPADQRDCPWCGTSLAFAQTVPGTGQ